MKKYDNNILPFVSKAEKNKRTVKDVHTKMHEEMDIELKRIQSLKDSKKLWESYNRAAAAYQEAIRSEEELQENSDKASEDSLKTLQYLPNKENPGYKQLMLDLGIDKVKLPTDSTSTIMTEQHARIEEAHKKVLTVCGKAVHYLIHLTKLRGL